MVQTPGFEPRATLEGGEGSQHCATLAPIHHKFSLLHNSMYYEFWKANYICVFWEMEM